MREGLLGRMKHAYEDKDAFDSQGCRKEAK